MAKAYECDRCKKLFTEKGPKTKRIYVSYSINCGGCVYDLCPECQKQLDDWWDCKVTPKGDCHTCKYNFIEAPYAEEPCQSCLDSPELYSKYEPDPKIKEVK